MSLPVLEPPLLEEPPPDPLDPLLELPLDDEPPDDVLPPFDPPEPPEPGATVPPHAITVDDSNDITKSARALKLVMRSKEQCACPRRDRESPMKQAIFAYGRCATAQRERQPRQSDQ